MDYDQYGNVLHGVGAPTWGGSLWELLHPWEVQKIDDITGATPRSTYQVMSDAVGDMNAADAAAIERGQQIVSDIGSGIATVAGGAWSVAQLLVTALVAYAVIEVASKVPDQNKVKSRLRGYARKRVKHYRQRVARIVAGD